MLACLIIRFTTGSVVDAILKWTKMILGTPVSLALLDQRTLKKILAAERVVLIRAKIKSKCQGLKCH